MRSRGLVFGSRRYRGLTSPPATTYEDISRYGNNGTITGATWQRLPSGLWVESFDGNDFVEIVTNTRLNFTTSDFSIGFWIKPTGVITTEQRIYCRGLYNTDGYEVTLSSASHAEINLRTYQAAASQDSYSSANSMVLNVWKYVLITRSGVAAHIYINGVDDIATAGVHINPLTSARTPKIGIYDDKVAAPLTAQLSLCCIYNRALSVVEIRSHYNNEKSLFGL